MKKITLPSGAKLEIDLAPFADSNALNKAVAKELKSMKFDPELNLADPVFIKDLACTAFSSDEIMDALEVCFKRCTYNGLKIDSTTFEPEEARQDYFVVCREVLIEQIRPFAKGLLSLFSARA